MELHVFNIRTQMYRKDPMVLLQRKLYFSDPEGVQHFPVWGGGGVFILNTYFYGTPCLPMDPHKNTEAVILIETGV